ncbi:MAG: hypothetical protein WD603_02585 [Patescibacteria group bacterium]
MGQAFEARRDPEECFRKEEVHELFDAVVAEDFLKRNRIGVSERIRNRYFGTLPEGSPLARFYRKEVLVNGTEQYPVLDEFRREAFFRFCCTLDEQRTTINSVEEAISEAQAITEQWLGEVFLREPDKIPESGFIEEAADAFREQHAFVRAMRTGQ